MIIAIKHEYKTWLKIYMVRDNKKTVTNGQKPKNRLCPLVTIIKFYISFYSFI